MKVLKLVISVSVTVGLIYLLNNSIGAIPPLGKLLSPQQGLWCNGDHTNDFKSNNLSFNTLKGSTKVYFDKRLVPHIFSDNDADAYFIQGYMHAKYRLWQMEFQTYYAAGRLCEIVGEKALPLDRKFRRLGMVYAAKNSMIETAKDSLSNLATNNYTNGVNAYIESLTAAQYPIEYKLLNYKPEAWTNLKTALLLKYMSYDLAGYEDDFEKQNTKKLFTKLMYETIYQYGNDSLSPITPLGTLFAQPGVTLKVPKSADSLYFNYKKDTSISATDNTKPNRNNGSNNWAVSGSKTKSGKPILCNDPHLGLNLPSLWYEMQIHTPTQNVYGASFPGSPAIIIGFNDSASFGFTNAMRDVRDYYEIKFKDNSKKEYWFNNQWQATTLTYDTILIKGKPAYIDTIAYVKQFGPVMYDASYRGTGLTNTTSPRSGQKNYAVKWIAHTPSNELQSFLGLNRSRTYNDYLAAISTFICPGQNMIFASHNGDIAIKQQGLFPAKWYRQGDFPMPGFDSSYMWQAMIPANENITMHNPERGFVSSANQYPYDTKTYPYYLGGYYPYTRGLYVNKRLAASSNITVTDMQNLQTDNYNIYAAQMLPLLLQYTQQTQLDATAAKYLTIAKAWNKRGDTNEIGQTIFYEWTNKLEELIWQDELKKINNPAIPSECNLYDAIKRDSNMVFVDNINTPQKETLRQLVTQALQNIVPKLNSADSAKNLTWSRYKKTRIKHLMDAQTNLAFTRFNIPIGGGVHMLNATTTDHGPSWRMIVEMTDKVNAYGIYPGGQSGNPGSKYYDDFITDWAAGKYYKLWLMQVTDVASNDILFTQTFSNL